MGVAFPLYLTRLLNFTLQCSSEDVSGFLVSLLLLGLWPLLGGIVLVAFALLIGMAPGIALVLAAWRPLQLLVSKNGVFPFILLLVLVCAFAHISTTSTSELTNWKRTSANTQSAVEGFVGPLICYWSNPRTNWLEWFGPQDGVCVRGINPMFGWHCSESSEVTYKERQLQPRDGYGVCNHVPNNHWVGMLAHTLLQLSSFDQDIKQQVVVDYSRFFMEEILGKQDRWNKFILERVMLYRDGKRYNSVFQTENATQFFFNQLEMGGPG